MHLPSGLTQLMVVLCYLVALSVQQTPVCNGSPALCDRQYSNVSFIATHDSAFAGPLLSDNQNVPIEDQLNAGIRFLQAQVHLNDGTLEMCHTSCLLLDAGSLESYLGRIKTWMDAHTQEVVTLLLVNGDNSPVSNFSDAFSSSGLQQYAFIPSQNPLPIGAWPTLNEMITKGSRLVAMLDAGADANSVPFLLDEFTYFFETPYAITSDDGFQQCNIDRPSGASADGRMYIMNHFLDINLFDTGIDVPDRLDAAKTNAASGDGSIGQQLDVCVGAYNRYPNGVLVDWFDQGDVFTAQNRMNGL